MKNLKKQILLLTIFVMFSGIALGQDEKRVLTIGGVDPETAKKMHDYDEILTWGDGDAVFKIEMKNTRVKPWVLKTMIRGKFTFDRASKTYNLNLSRTITEKPAARFNEKMTIRIYVATTMGNNLWTEIERMPEDIEKPIILDRYSGMKFHANAVPQKTLYVSLTNPGALSTEMYESVQRAEGEYLDVIGQGFYIWLKNEGSANWTAGKHETWPKKIHHPDSSLWTRSYKFTPGKDGNQFDMYKPLVLRIAIPTNFGNVVWLETPYSAKKSAMRQTKSDELKFTHFTGKVADPDATLSTKKMQGGAGLVPFGVDPSTVAAPVEIKEAPTAANSGVELKQHRTTLLVENRPDSAYNKNFTSTLLQDGSVMIGLATINLEGEKPITYNPGRGYVLSATVKGDQTIKTKMGSFTIKGGSVIEFQELAFKSIVLAEDATFMVECGRVPLKARNVPGEFDLEFGRDGKLTAATVAKDVSYTVMGASITVTEGSKVGFNRKFFDKIQLSKNIDVELEGMTLQVQPGTEKTPSMVFDTKRKAIESLCVAEAPIMSFDGFDMPVKSGSKMVFEYEDGAYSVKQFVIDKQMDLVLTSKKGKTKEKTAKAGKRITIRGGKLAKIS